MQSKIFITNQVTFKMMKMRKKSKHFYWSVRALRSKESPTATTNSSFSASEIARTDLHLSESIKLRELKENAWDSII